MTPASGPRFPLEIVLESGRMTDARTCPQEIDDARLPFILRQWRWGIINACLLQRFVNINLSFRGVDSVEGADQALAPPRMLQYFPVLVRLRATT
jgi:hypothetical protein